MQPAIASARQNPIKQSTIQVQSCLVVYQAIQIMIGALKHWYDSLPVCIFAANFVTAK